MLTTTERETMISIIRELPVKIEALVKDLNDEQLDTPCAPGEWTVRQVVHHLADSHLNSFIRLKLILTEDHPPLKGYDQEAWATLADSDLPLEATFFMLRGLHQRWTTLFDKLSPAQWQRSGSHSEIGDITPLDLVQIYAQHCNDHIDQITRLLVAQGWTSKISTIIAALDRSQQDFLDILSQGEAETLYKNLPEEPWTAAMVLAHIAEARQFFATQIKKAVTTTGSSATIGRTMEDPHRLEALEKYGQDSPAELRDKLISSHKAMLQTLSTITPDQLSLTVIHITQGDFSLSDFIQRFLVGHDRLHVQQVTKLIDNG